MGRREEDIIEAAQAICNTRHPSMTRKGTRYCNLCMGAANAAVAKLEERGWMDREGISDAIHDAQDEG